MYAIVYDLDGTLVDSSGNIVAAVNRVRSAYGLTPISVKTCLPYIGNGAHDLIARAVFGQVDDGMTAPKDILHVSEYEFNAVFRDFYEGYVAHPAAGHSIFPGVLDALSYFSELGIRQAVLTNKPHGVTMLVLQALGLSDYFHSVLGAHAPLPTGDLLPPKPDTRGMELTLSALGIAANDAVMVGDGRPDIQVAKAVGMRSLAIAGGFSEACVLEALEPTWLVDTFQDAYATLASLLN